MWLVLYNLLLSAGLVFYIPYLLLAAIFDRSGLGERLGWYPKRIHPVDKSPRIWIHVASVGEVRAVRDFVEKLHTSLPQTSLLLSTCTRQGKLQAQRLFPDIVVIYLPIDHPWILHRVMNLIRPRVVCVAETELWPNFLREARAAGAFLFLINGRISTQSFIRYRRLRSLFAPAVEGFGHCFMQTQRDAVRIIALGAQSEKVTVVGSFKLDIKLSQPSDQLRRKTREKLGFAEEAPVIIAGSTRPGEEEILLTAYQRLRSSFPQLKLLLAPRHLQRVGEIEQLAKGLGIATCRRSVVAVDGSSATAVMILDTMGELAQLYAAGDVAFVGGSLVPYGGHNPLEPAAVGTPVLFGPSMEHSQRAVDLLVASGMGIQVSNVIDFVQEVRQILSKQTRNDEAISCFSKLLEQERGVANHCVEVICSLLAGKV